MPFRTGRLVAGPTRATCRIGYTFARAAISIIKLTNPSSLAALLCCLCLVSALGAEQEKPPLQAVDALGAAIFSHTASTGMVVVVVRDRDVTMQSFGQTAPGSGQRPDPNSLVRLCSITKILTTDLFVKLAQSPYPGQLAVTLDAPLQRFATANVQVPSRTVRGPGTRPLTLGDLATHTGGLPREIAYPAADAAHFTFPDRAFRWAWLPTFRLRTSPGTAAHYSNVGFDLLGDALETAAGRTYAQMFQERTAAPLGLHDTTLTPSAVQCARLLQGGRNEGPCTDTQAAAGSGGMYSTPADMARVLQYLLATPGFPARQDAAAQAIYLQPSELRSVQGLDHAGPPTGLGLGWVRLGMPDDPGMILQKTGGGAGFLTYIALDQARHIGIFVAATEGRQSNHANLFREANDLLLYLAGLPPTPAEPGEKVTIEKRASASVAAGMRRHAAGVAGKRRPSLTASSRKAQAQRRRGVRTAGR